MENFHSMLVCPLQEVVSIILIVYKTNNYSLLHIVKQVTSDQEESTSMNIVLLSIATSSTFTIVNPQHACARGLQ